MEILNKETFKTKVFDFEKNKEWLFAGQKPTIVDFYADWCAPCRALSPILDDVSKSYGNLINVYKVNTEQTPELASLFGVRGIPAVLFIPVNGKPVMSSGFIPKENMEQAIQEILKINVK